MPDFNVGFVVFPGVTQLDFTSPFELLTRGPPPSVDSVSSRFPDARTHVAVVTEAMLVEPPPALRDYLG